MAAGADRRHGRRRVCAAGVMPADMDADIAAVMAAARVLSEQSLQESHGAFSHCAAAPLQSLKGALGHGSGAPGRGWRSFNVAVISRQSGVL